MRSLSVLLLFITLAGCGPRVNPADLPLLPDVATGHFLAAVTGQLDNLRAGVERDPLDGKKTGELGKAYLAYQLDEAAEVALRRARMLQPRKFEWMYYHARALQRLGQLSEAIELLEGAVDAKSYPPARVLLGDLYLQTGDLQTAMAQLQAVVAAEEKQPKAKLSLARAYLRADKAQQAQRYLDELTEQFGHVGEVYFALGDVARRMGNNEAAKKYLLLFEKYRNVRVPVNDPLMRALAHLDLSEKPLLAAARRLNQTGRTDEAMQLLHQALARNPDSDLTHAALVGAYGALKQFDKADEHYRLALESGPATAPLLRNLARARFHEKRYTEARELLEQALQINPHDASALTWSGLVRMAQRDTVSAVDFFKRALEENPREDMARQNLVGLLRRQERHAEALLHMKELVVVEDRHSPRVWREMALSYMSLGHDNQARDALTRSVASAQNQDNDVEARKSALLLQRLEQ